MSFLLPCVTAFRMVPGSEQVGRQCLRNEEMNEQEASMHTFSPFLMSFSSPLTPGNYPTSHSHTAKENKSITFVLLDEICLMHFGHKHCAFFNTVEEIAGNETV